MVATINFNIVRHKCIATLLKIIMGRKVGVSSLVGNEPIPYI